MKQAPNNNALDTFLKEKLASREGNIPVVDWSEMEVLLGPEQKQIPININISKKQILYAALVVAAGAGLFGIFKAVQYYSSLPDESVSPTDTMHTTLDMVDPGKAALTESVVPATPVTQLDSAEILEKKADSVLNASDAFLKKMSVPQVNPVDAAGLQPDKKKKKKKDGTVPIDSSALTMPVETLPPPDTAQRRAPEIKSSPADTSKGAAPPKNGKTKKSKKQKGAPSDPGVTPAKTDSVK